MLTGRPHITFNVTGKKELTVKMEWPWWGEQLILAVAKALLWSLKRNDVVGKIQVPEWPTDSEEATGLFLIMVKHDTEDEQIIH